MASFTDQEVSTGHARKLAKNFKQLKLKNGRIKKDDAQGIWFSKDLLLKALADTSDPNKKTSGIRFYLGAYEENHPKYPNQKHYRGKLTLVLVQTYALVDANGNPVLDDDFKTPIQKDILDDPDATPGYDKDEKLQEYNDGQLCPPPHCDEEGLLNFE